MEDVFAICENRKCRKFNKRQYVGRPEFDGGRLVTACPYCMARLFRLSEKDLREYRQAKNDLQDRRQS